MAYCSVCERVFEDSSLFCDICGVSLRRTANKIHSLSVTGSKIYPSQLIALALALAMLAIQFFMSPSVLVQAFLFSVTVGCVIVVSRFRFTARVGEQLANAISREKDRARQGGRLARWAMRPLYSICDAIPMLTKHLKDPFIRTGLDVPFWLVFGSIAALLVIYVVIIVAVLVVGFVLVFFVLWALDKLSDKPDDVRQSEPESPTVERPPDLERGTILRSKDGRLTRVGIIERDLGQLHRRDFETLETSNMFGPNFRLVENRTLLGLDTDRPYRVETEKGEHLGEMVKEPFSDNFRFEPAKKK